MITFLNGKLAEKQPTRVVLDVAGVGYEVFIPLSSYDRLPPLDAACRILIYDCIREDDHLLFGFMTEPERQLFLMLVSVTGIGPKIAMSALSGMTVREIKGAIVEGDVKRLSSVNGIGKKTAERMVVELRDRISKGEAMEAVSGAPQAVPEDTRARDAVLALAALGFQPNTARDRVVAALKQPGSSSLSVEALVKKALAGG
jgi:Holliday junction DNA helicase RuvA